MERVFVSHSHRDKERFADGLVRRLRDAGVDVWYDTPEVKAGHTLPESVLNTGLPSCGIFISVLSTNSRDSQWVRKELNIALVRQLKHQCRIIPIVLDGAKVPVSISDIAQVEIRDTNSYDSEFDRVIAGIRDPEVHEQGGRYSTATPVDLRQRVPSRWRLAAPSNFVNREDELATLHRVLEDAQDSDRPRIAVLTGMPGVGKSALASHWGKSVCDRFSDGGLYVDFAPHGRGQNDDLSDILMSLLSELGVPDDALPATTEAQTDTFRRMTSDKQLLLVADNVSDAGQIKQTLPSGRGSMVVATTNEYLGELAVRYEAEMLEVSVLNDINSATMLRELAKRDRSADTDEDWRDLSEACGGLPIAIAVTAERLRRHPAWTVRDMVKDILSADDPIVALAGDDDRSLKRSLDAAYSSFDEQLQRFYRRIGMFPGRTLEPATAAVISDIPYDKVHRLLDRLNDLHLIFEVGYRRYEVHQLIVRHMRELFGRHESPEESNRLAMRLIDWYYGAIRCADRAVAKDRLRIASDEEIHSAVPFPKFSSPSEAYEWYMSERYDIQDVMRMAFDMAHCERLWGMAESLWLFFSARRLFADWQECVELGVEAARICKHRDAEARLRSQLARVHAERGEHGRAHTEILAALDQVEASDNLVLRASVTEFHGICMFLAGKDGDALAAFDRTRTQMEMLGSARGVAIADLLRSRVFIRTGDVSAAAETARRCRDEFERLDDPVNAAKAAFEVARSSVDALSGDEAVTEARRAVDSLNEMGLAYHSAQAHELVARLLHEQDQHAEAERYWQTAYQLYRQLGHSNAERIEAAILADLD